MNAPAQALTLTFALQRPADVPADSAQPLRFSGIAYSGDIVPHYGWMGDIAIDLSALQNPDGDTLPVLIDHDTRIGSIAGRGEIRRQVDADGLVSLHIAGEITGATDAGQRIARLMAEGYPLQLSVGISANVREVSEPIAVNGRVLDVAAVFEQPLVREVSFVAVGADPNTTAQQLSATHLRKDAPAMTRTAEDQALIERLTAQVEALQSQMTAQEAERRRADLSALFADLGRDAPDGEAVKPYLEMSALAFTAYAADLRAAHQGARRVDATLFSAQGVLRAGQDEEGAPTSNGAALLAAVKNLSSPAHV